MKCEICNKREVIRGKVICSDRCLKIRNQIVFILNEYDGSRDLYSKLITLVRICV